MKAAVLKANSEIEVQDIPLLPPGEDECTIKIRYAGICSSDIFRGFEGGAYHYPLVMGHELSGEIVSIGPSCKGFSIGQRVTIFPLKPCFQCSSCQKYEYAQCHNYSYYGSRCDGGFSEFLNVANWNILPLPDNVSLQDGALTEPMSVVVHAINRAKNAIDEATEMKSVAIIGSGFLGLLAVQILHHLYPSLRITIFDRNRFKLDFAQKYGAIAKIVIDSDGWDEHLQLERKRHDIVFEASGAPENFSRSIELSMHGGIVVWMGNITNNLELNKGVVSSILRKEIKILGTWNSSYKSPNGDDWKHALQLMHSGIKPAKLITQWASLENMADFLALMHAHKTNRQLFEHIKCMICND